MDSTGLVTVIVALLTLVGTLAVPLINKLRQRPAKKDRVELFFERYDEDRKNDRSDIAAFRKEVQQYKKEADEARAQLDELRAELAKALSEVDERDERINRLERKVSAGNVKYSNLLRRFNIAQKKLAEVEKTTK